MEVPPPSPKNVDVTRIRRDQVQAILEITRRLVGSLDVEELIDTLLDSLIRVFQVDRGLLMLRDEARGEFAVRAARNLDGKDLATAADVSRRVVESVQKSGAPILTPDAQEDEGLKDLTSIAGKGIRGLICHPLTRQDRVIGVVYLDSRGTMNYLGSTAQAFVSTLCNLASVALDNARRHQEVVSEARELRGELRKLTALQAIVGTSGPMETLRRKIESVAPTPASVLLVGESGTGKEMVARAIHERSQRSGRKFVAVNCGEFPETLVESELFGYKKGAFTGAVSDRKGLFEEADEGTLFLDEITNTSPTLQAKLLRVLQEGEIRRVGENATRRVDVRIVCATNADLPSLVRDGKFREDLYYRINVVALRLPPLRERKDDVPLLVQHFIAKHNPRYGKQIQGVTPEAERVLREHDWPGNVRELENVIQKGMALGHGDVIGPRDLGMRIGAEKAFKTVQFRDEVQAFERGLIQQALDAAGGNISKAAESLGMVRQQLHRMVQKYGLSAEALPPDATGEAE